LKLPLCHGRRVLPCGYFFRIRKSAAYSDRRIRRNGNNRNFERFPVRCDVARPRILSVAADRSAVYIFPNLNVVSYGNALKGSALYLLVNDFRVFVIVKNNDCFPPVAFDPGPLNAAQNFVAMVIKKQDAYIIQAGKVYGSGPVV